MKFWAKVQRGDKIIADTIYENTLPLTTSGYRTMLQEMCAVVDVSTPVTLPSHLKHLSKFNRVKYIPRDFVEEVDFTAFVIEIVPEK